MLPRRKPSSPLEPSTFDKPPICHKAEHKLAIPENTHGKTDRCCLSCSACSLCFSHASPQDSRSPSHLHSLLLALPSAVLVSHLALHTSLTVTCDHSARHLPPVIKVDCPVTDQIASIAAHGHAGTQSGYLLALIMAVVFFYENPDRTSGPG